MTLSRDGRSGVIVISLVEWPSREAAAGEGSMSRATRLAQRRDELRRAAPRRRRRRSFLGGILSLGLIVAACGDGDGESGEAVTVTWWIYQEPHQMDILEEEFVRPFNEAHDDVQLEMRRYHYDELQTAISTAIQAGEGPDIVTTGGPSFVAEFANADRLVDLSDYAEQYGWQDLIFPWAMSAGEVDGTLYSLPHTWETLVLWYNRAVFDEYGWQPPQDRDELEAIIDEAVANDMLPFTSGNADWQGVNEWILSVLYQGYSGPEAFYGAVTERIAWTDDLLVGAVDLFREWMEAGYFRGRAEAYYTAGDDATWTDLVQGVGAMHVAGTWAFQNAVSYFEEQPDDWDWAPFPTLRDGVEPGFTLSIGTSLAINDNSENPDAAAQVLDYVYADPDRAARIAARMDGTWLVPIDLDLEGLDEVDPRFARHVEEVSAASERGNYGYTIWTFLPPRTQQHHVEAIERVLNGQIDSGAFMQEVQDIFEEEAADGRVPPIPEPNA